MRNDPPPNCSAAPVDDENLLRWKAMIKGPPDSPYEGGEFHLTINLQDDYPNKPPRVKFQTKIYHPNIDAAMGSVCLSILAKDWSSQYNIRVVLLAIYCLLTDPNPDDPVQKPAAELYKENIEQYNEKARKWTRKYAVHGHNQPNEISDEDLDDVDDCTLM